MYAYWTLYCCISSRQYHYSQHKTVVYMYIICDYCTYMIYLYKVLQYPPVIALTTRSVSPRAPAASCRASFSWRRVGRRPLLACREKGARSQEVEMVGHSLSRWSEAPAIPRQAGAALALSIWKGETVAWSLIDGCGLSKPLSVCLKRVRRKWRPLWSLVCQTTSETRPLALFEHRRSLSCVCLLRMALPHDILVQQQQHDIHCALPLA